MMKCRNGEGGKYLFFLPREMEITQGRLAEAYKIDLHISAKMRNEEKSMTGSVAADAAKRYLIIMNYLFGESNRLRCPYWQIQQPVKDGKLSAAAHLCFCIQASCGLSRTACRQSHRTCPACMLEGIVKSPNSTLR